MNDSPVVSLNDVSVDYNTGEERVRALERVSLDIYPATSTSITGRSGSGKSTLVSVLSLLRRPSRGLVRMHGRDTTKMTDAELSGLRGTSIGTVFQSFHLDPTFTAEANVLLPWYFSSGLSRRRARVRARGLLELIGIPELANRYPGQMSGGQRQRVAIARALFTQPPLVIADEPTGNLDEDTAGTVADLLYSLPERLATAVIVVTHDLDIAAKAQQRIDITRGRISSSLPPPSARAEVTAKVLS